MLKLIGRLAVIGIMISVVTVPVLAQQKPFELHGTYLEGCSCKMVCSCDLYGAMVPGCTVMGALIINSGHFGDSDLSGTNIAFAIGDKWVRIYIQADNPNHLKTAEEFGRAAFGAYGNVELVSAAKVELSKDNGKLTLKVEDGKAIRLSVQPVLGANQKTAVTYTNYPDPLFHTIMQGKVISGEYSDNIHHFTLEDSNSFFNQDWNISGEM